MKNKYLFALLYLLALSCGKAAVVEPEPEEPGPGEEFWIPDAPQNAVEANVFAVEYFLSLPSEAETSSHILNSKDKRPVLYLFGHVQYVPGKPNALVKTAVASKCYPFFIQSGETSFSGNGGTGFLTRYSISSFDGECSGVPFGGPTVTLALSAAEDITIYGCNASAPEQLASVVESRSKAFYGDAVMLGVYDGDADRMKEFAEVKALGMRFDHISVGDRVIYTLVQPGYVNRGFETNRLGGTDYVKVLFEKLY